jgi:hypothetical protein
MADSQFNADALLAELGQCSRLQSLSLGFELLFYPSPASKITRQGALALAGGPAGQSLQSVWIDVSNSYELRIDAAAVLVAGPCRAPKVLLFDVELEGEPPHCAEQVALAQQLARYVTLAVEGVTCKELDDLDGYCRFGAAVLVAGKEEVYIVVGCEGELDFEDEDEDEGYHS